MSREKEEDEKLYKVVKKRNSHINTKMNPDGSKAALQFSDENNGLTGPVDLIEVDREELVRTEYIELGPEPRTFGEIIVEDVVAPIAREALEDALEIGVAYFEKWMHDTVAPKARKKSKELGENIKIVFSAIKDSATGKETKAEQILREREKKNTAVTTKASSDVKTVSSEEKEKSAHKEEHTEKEIREVIGIMRSSAVTLAACIRWLNNAVLEDDGSDPDRRLEIQRNLEEVSTAEVMEQIDFLLEDKNRDLLNEASRKLLKAFREGNFIVNGKKIPVSRYLQD